MKIPRILLAAGASGSGKTLITCGLLQVLANRGIPTASFKCGPDYIDPMFHSRVIGTKSRNLDTFFTSPEITRYLLGKNARDCRIAVMEGVMGYYDGVGGTTSRASAYDLASVTDTPVILVINKVDTVKKEELILSIEAYRKELDFQEIVPVSALKGDNTRELIKCIMKYLPYGPYFYDEETVTDQPVRQIAAELIREKALRLLSEEIPHGIAVSIESMKRRRKIWDIEATIICEKDSHKKIVIGKGGQMLKKIGSTARVEIEKMLESQVNLQLWVKVKKDWRDSDFLLKNFGYHPKDAQGGE